MDELLLGLDIGTSSSKAVLASPDGAVVATAEQAHSTSMPRPGWVEHDAEKVWWADTQALMASLGREKLASVKGVCISGIGPCLLPVDAKGEPLRPAVLYGVDTRATAEAEELTERYGAEAVLAVGGSPLTSQALGPKLLWLRRHEPDVWRGARRFLMASSFVVYGLTGEYVLDHHSASQCNPLYDLGAFAWRAEWADDIAPGLELPPLAWPGEAVGTVSQPAASQTGVPAGTPVAAGTIDSWAEAFGVGVVAPGDTMLSYGTTMFIVQVAPSAKPDSHLWLTAGVGPGARTVAAGMATSGALTSWLWAIAGGVAYEQLLAEAGQVPAGAEGVVVLPYFGGERTPLFDPDARGAILGLTLRHSRGHLYRALLESTAFGVRHNLEAIEQAGGSVNRLVATGGGTRGHLWAQVVSDVTGRGQELRSPPIGASYGDAHLAGAAARLVALEANWGELAGAVQPNLALGDLYHQLYHVYRGLYPATKHLAHQLARAQSASSTAGTETVGTASFAA